MKNNRGEVVTIVVIAIAAFLLGSIGVSKLNPFGNDADPANRRTASSLSGRDIVDITKAAGESQVDVRIDRSVEVSSEVTDPPLTVGQRIGRFISRLSWWMIAGVIFAIFVLGISPAAILAWSRNAWKNAFKNTVAGIRKVPDDLAVICPDCKKATIISPYDIVTDELKKSQNTNDKVMVDKAKMELPKE